jgi:hypothetical protein
MAEKRQEADQIPRNGLSGVDQESLAQAQEEKRKKRIKWAIYIAAFSVFQVIVILVFVLVVMRVRGPKFRVGSLDALSVSNNQTSLTISFEAPIRVKNMNFGPFKYHASNVTFTSGNVLLQQVPIPKGTAGFMSTKKIDVPINYGGGSLGNLDPSSGVLTLNSTGSLSGKVEMMLIFKKKKTIEMDCVFTINTKSNSVQSKCK